MAEYVPDDRDELFEPSADVAALFAEVERQLIAAVGARAAAAIESGEDMVAALRTAGLEALAARLVAVLRDTAPEAITVALAAAAQAGAQAAVVEMTTAVGVSAAVAGVVALRVRAPEFLRREMNGVVNAVTARILRFPDDVYRRAVAQQAADVLLGEATTQQAQARAWQQLAGQGVTGFTDTAGRRWNAASYVEMATRTATRRAWDAEHEATILSNGVELVSIVAGNDGCKECMRWTGKVLRLNDGPTGRLKVPSMAGDGDVTVTVVATLSEARRQGWQHPNCRCRTVAYLPGLSVVADATTYDPVLEGQRERLRLLERRVRAAKAQEASGLTPQARAKAKARRLDLSRQIAAHVAETGLNRKRRREQIDLGARLGGLVRRARGAA